MRYGIPYPASMYMEYQRSLRFMDITIQRMDIVCSSLSLWMKIKKASAMPRLAVEGSFTTTYSFPHNKAVIRAINDLNSINISGFYTGWDNPKGTSINQSGTH